ncbi:sulfate adenylyltransferase [bacterium]|nr:sulfate adenylyltransferase [bacterium]
MSLVKRVISGRGLPHGGRLIKNFVSKEGQRKSLIERARRLRQIAVPDRIVSDIEMLASGALSPLTGFMGSKDLKSVLRRMHLANGLPWTIPIILPVSAALSDEIRRGESVALTTEAGQVLAILKVAEKYGYDKSAYAQAVYRTASLEHPAVKILMDQGEVALAGPVRVIARYPYANFHEYRLDPEETRRRFAAAGWKRIVGFQTRNPVHRAHEFIQKCAMEIVDGLLLHPLVGETKSDDIPADVRMRCYEALIQNYYPQNRVLLSVNPAAMRYAGPREAIFHAIVRKNFGCTHFIVGRDHAGVGNFYGPFDAQDIFDEFDPQLLGITPLFFDNSFFCRACGNMATPKTCPHAPENRVSLSGTQVRQMLSAGQVPPAEFTRPEVAQVLIELMRTDKPVGAGAK